MVDVVNEPLLGHNRPDGSPGDANYINALGGLGKTGWDWVITAFTMAREYLPHAKLLINDFNIINSSDKNTHSLFLCYQLIEEQGTY